MNTAETYFNGMDYKTTIEAIARQPHLAQGTIAALQDLLRRILAHEHIQAYLPYDSADPLFVQVRNAIAKPAQVEPAMTAEAFLAKFPATEAEDEDSGVYDLACPKCGNRVSFRIEFTGMCDVAWSGSEDDGDHEWQGNSYCCCNGCDHSATVDAFTFEGLDTLITERRAA